MPHDLADPHTHADAEPNSFADAIAYSDAGSDPDANADADTAADAVPVRVVGHSAELHLAHADARAYAWIDAADDRNQSLLGL